jgi:hypothetical protein
MDDEYRLTNKSRYFYARIKKNLIIITKNLNLFIAEIINWHLIWQLLDLILRTNFHTLLYHDLPKKESVIVNFLIHIYIHML